MKKSKNIGWVRPKDVTHQNDRMASFSEISVPKIEQGGPTGSVEFVYVDISSVDNKLKRITAPKTLDVAAAPSRAKQRLKAGDVLVSMTRPNLNAVAMVPHELDGAVGSTGFHVLRAIEGTEPRWLFYAVQSNGFVSAMSELVQGALYPAVRPKDILAFEIAAPPLEQQKHIVAEIEKQFSWLDEAIANLQRVKANLKRYKAAVLKAAVEGRLVETEAELARRQGRDFETGEQLLQRILKTRRSQWQGKGKYKEPAAPDMTGLPELPEGWVWATAVQICDRVIDCHNKTAPYTDSGIKLVRTSNIRDGGLLLDGVRYVDKFTYDFWSKRCPPSSGDVLFTREAPMGEAAIIPQGTQLCMGQRMMLMRPSKAILAEFLLYALLSPVIKRLIRLSAVGSGVKHLRVGDVELLPIPLPPLPEQHRIVTEVDRRLSQVREGEVQVETNLKRAERLRQAILSKAFSGRLMA